VLLSGTGLAQPKDPKRPTLADVSQSVSRLVEEQRDLARVTGQLRQDLGAMQQSLADLQAELRQQREAAQAAHTHDREMREEVRGLYVESSGLKGDIAQVSTQVEALQQEVGNFRFSSGIIAALIIVLQLVVAGLALRGRG
jgi:methyl-accepting chemotaxis protein